MSIRNASTSSATRSAVYLRCWRPSAGCPTRVLGEALCGGQGPPFAGVSAVWRHGRRRPRAWHRWRRPLVRRRARFPAAAQPPCLPAGSLDSRSAGALSVRGRRSLPAWHGCRVTSNRPRWAAIATQATNLGAELQDQTEAVCKHCLRTLGCGPGCRGRRKRLRGERRALALRLHFCDQRLGTEDLDHSLQVVGQDLQAHLGSHAR